MKKNIAEKEKKSLQKNFLASLFFKPIARKPTGLDILYGAVLFIEEQTKPQTQFSSSHSFNHSDTSPFSSCSPHKK